MASTATGRSSSSPPSDIQPSHSFSNSRGALKFSPGVRRGFPESGRRRVRHPATGAKSAAGFRRTNIDKSESGSWCSATLPRISRRTTPAPARFNAASFARQAVGFFVTQPEYDLTPVLFNGVYPELPYWIAAIFHLHVQLGGRQYPAGEIQNMAQFTRSQPVLRTFF